MGTYTTKDLVRRSWRGHADAVGEGVEAGQGSAAGSEEVFGHAVDWWPVADLSRGGAFGAQ
jgi:hypothetical protein